MEEAKKTKDFFYSKPFQQKICGQQHKILKDNHVHSLNPATGPVEKEEPLAAGTLYLFLSSSMPKDTFRNYLLDIEEVKSAVVPIMKGMVRGMRDKKANIRFFSEVLKKDSACFDAPRKRCERFKTDILFQPPYFSQFNVTQVPTLIYVQGQEVYKIEGDASLAYLLERINEKAKQKDLKNLIGKLKNG